MRRLHESLVWVQTPIYPLNEVEASRLFFLAKRSSKIMFAEPLSAACGHQVRLLIRFIEGLIADDASIFV